MTKTKSKQNQPDQDVRYKIKHNITSIGNTNQNTQASNNESSGFRIDYNIIVSSFDQG